MCQKGGGWIPLRIKFFNNIKTDIAAFVILLNLNAAIIVQNAKGVFFEWIIIALGLIIALVIEITSFSICPFFMDFAPVD